MALKSRSALGSALSLAMPRLGIDTREQVRIGVLAPLSGRLRAWAEPGYNGCLIWRDRVNAAGGVHVGDRRYAVEIIPFDTRFEPERAIEGARKLITEDGVQLLAMLGGNDFTREVRELVNRTRTLVTTLLPSDLTPDAPTLIAPSEVHPVYNVTGVDWLKRDQPSIRTAALCTQDDALGLPSIATYRAAFEAAGIELVAEELFPVETRDFGPIFDRLMAVNPDVLCWDTAYEPFVQILTVEAYKRGFKGRILSCTCDDYRALVEQTSKEFMEGFVFQFPDFDDPMLDRTDIGFSDPEGFYREFCARFPGEWSAVSWEYASSLELWKTAVERARTFNPMTVMAMMKVGGEGRHAFGQARWWGRDLFGVDNALVGSWPVVVVRDGRARIVEFASILDWWDAHGPVLIKHMRALNLMWDQRRGAASAARAG